MSANWQSISSSPSIDEAWASWKTVFFGIVHDHIPSKLVSSPRPQLPWMSDSLRTLIKQKHAAFRQLKLSPTDQYHEKICAIRNKVTHLFRKAERQHIQSLHRSCKLSKAPSSRGFWKFMKSCLGSKAHALSPTW